MILPLLEQTSIRWIKDKNINIEDQTVAKLFHNSENLINSKYEEVEQTRAAAVSHTEFSDYPLIAHACGGYVHRKKREDTNSPEAFKEAVANGFKMFE